MKRHALILLALVLAAAPSAFAAANAVPAADTVDPGGLSTQVSVRLVFPPAPMTALGEVAVKLPSGLAGEASILPAATLPYPVEAGDTTATVSFKIRTRRAADPGVYTIVATDKTSGAGSATFRLTVRDNSTPPPPPPPPSPPPVPPTVMPDFSMTVAPAALRLATIGDRAEAVIDIEATDLTEPVGFAVSGLPSGVRLVAVSDTRPPMFRSRTLRLHLDAAAPAGTYALRVSGTASGLAPRIAPLTLVIDPPAPVITAVTPSRVVAGQPMVRLTLTGRFFDQQAAVLSDSPAVTVLATEVINAETAVVRARIAPADQRALAALRVANSSGRASEPSQPIVVDPSASLDAPFSVRSVAVTQPRPGRQIGARERVHAVGVVIASGTGLISGSWLLDDVVFDRFTQSTVAGAPMRVRSRVPIPSSYRGPHQLTLRIDSPSGDDDAMSSPPILVQSIAEGASELRTLLPEAGSRLGSGEEIGLRWSLLPGARAYRVELARIDDEDERQPVLSAETAETLLLLDSGLAPGRYEWRVRALYVGGAEGKAVDWQAFEVVAEGSQQARGRLDVRLASDSSVDQDFGSADAANPTNPATGFDDLEARFEVTRRAEEDDTGETAQSSTLAGSFSGARFGRAAETQATVDASWFGDDDDDIAQDSENWLLSGDLGSESWSLAGRAGYAGPGSLAFLELMSPGFARGGAEVVLGHGSGLQVSGYQSFEAELGSVAGGSFGGEQELQALSMTVGTVAGRGHLGIHSLRVDAAATDWELGGEGSAVGVSGHLAAGVWTFEGEASRGDFETSDPFASVPLSGRPSGSASGVSDDKRQGDAWRLELRRSGRRGELALRTGRTESGFVNPANRGLAVAGQSDRRTLELEGSVAGERWDWGGTLEQIEGEEGSSRNPQARQATTVLSLTPNQRFTATLEGGWSAIEANAEPDQLLSRTDTQVKRFSATLSESFGALELSQQFAVRRLEDAVDPRLSTDASEASLGVNVFGSGQWSLASSLHWTEVEGAAEGRTETALASLQPSWRSQAGSLVISGYASYLQNSNDLYQLDATDEQYQAQLAWTPDWLDSLLGLEVTGTWTRSSSLPEAGFQASYVVALTLGWGVKRSAQQSASAAEWTAEPETSWAAPAAQQVIRGLEVPAIVAE